MNFMFVLLFPIVTTWLTKIFWPRKVGWAEMGIALVAGIAISAVVYACGMVSQTSDVEVWNGEVLSKERERVSCSHSYDCNCRMVPVPRSCTGSGKNRSCTGGGTERKCDTCYEHSNDYSWRVHTNIGNWTIDRVDRQGITEPPRWSVVNPGDPVSDTHSFTNYVKAVPESLFHAHADMTNTFDAMIPEYPSAIYDYWHINRAISMGVPVPDMKEWNRDISFVARDVGPKKQANIIVIFVNTADQSYIHALEGKWIGGKKNDIIVVIGSTSYPKIDWVAVSSWTDKALFKVQLRDDIMNLGNIDRNKIIEAIHVNTMKTFERKHMKDFEYLKYQIEPPFWVLSLAAVLGIIASLLTSYMFYRNNVGYRFR
jgi:hypothetical protein